jgi:hypothetical protein
VHPELPLPPKTFRADPPDTSGYTVQTVRQLPDGSCNIQQLIDAAAYGTVIELPQGMVCKVFPIKGNDSRGYGLRGKKLDPNAGGDINSPNHRWIVIRTAKGPAELTPPGVRVTPQRAAPFAKLEAQKTIGTGGEVFFSDHYGTPPHHYRIESLELTHTDSAALFPPDAADPEPVRSLISIAGHMTASIPTYIVCDRLYIHGRGFPGRLKFGIWLNGKYVALTNSHIDKVDYWRPYKWPNAPPVLSADRRMINVPAKSFQRNRDEKPWVMAQPATIGLSADMNFKGTFTGFLGPNGVVIDYRDSNPQAQAQATLYCVNCAAVKKAPADPPSNGYFWFSGTIATGQFTINNTRTHAWETSLHNTEGSSGIYTIDGAGPYLVENNYLEAYGIGYFIDGPGGASPSPSDIVFRHNHLIWNQDHRITSATSNGFTYTVRNMWEVKRGARMLVEGNLFEGTWSNATQGSTVFISSRPATKADWEQGSRDIAIKSNIIRNASAGFYCQGTSDIGSSPPSTGRVLIANNLIYGIDQFEQNVASPNGIGDNIRILNGCHDVTVRNNTFASNIGKRPAQLASGAGLWNEGLSFTDNLLYLNLGEGNAGGISIDYGNDARHPYVPAMASGPFKFNLDKAYIRIGATVEPNYTFTNNVIVGGVKGGSKATLADLDTRDMMGFRTQYPAGNFFPEGMTKAQREAGVKWTDVARHNYRLRPDSPYRAGGGVDYGELEPALGFTTQVAAPSPSADAAVFSYTAPDARACLVETSLDQFQTFKRTADTGGARPRRVTVENLQPDRKYAYRIVCYFEQVNDAAHPNAYPPGQITNGTFTTAAR